MKGWDLFRPATSVYPEADQALLVNPRAPEDGCRRLLDAEFPDLPSHLWLASSGTSGRLKAVALSRAAIETSARAVNKRLCATSSDFWLNPLPLFHVGGLGSIARAALAGGRCQSLEEWDAREFALLAARCEATLTSLVPAQVHDLVAAGLECPPSMRAAVIGGGSLGESLRVRAAELGWLLLPTYGMTEAASQVATAMPGAEDFSWLPLLDHIEARVGDNGVLELRGPSLLSGWMLFDPGGSSRWEDPKIDGWFRTSDRVELHDGKIRFVGRVDDLIKIRGELVDVAALERELQSRVPSGRVRIDAESDERNGFALSLVAENADAEAEARGAIDVFPPYARPTAFRVGPVAVSPLGKRIRPSRP